MKIEKLTPEQESKIPMYLKRYYDKVYNPKEVDKEKWFEGLTKARAFKLEKYLIKLMGRNIRHGGILTNLTDGGDGTQGFIVDEEMRSRLSENSFRMWADPDCRERHIKARIRRYTKKEEHVKSSERACRFWQKKKVRVNIINGQKRAAATTEARERLRQAALKRGAQLRIENKLYGRATAKVAQ